MKPCVGKEISPCRNHVYSCQLKERDERKINIGNETNSIGMLVKNKIKKYRIISKK